MVVEEQSGTNAIVLFGVWVLGSVELTHQGGGAGYTEVLRLNHM